MGNWTRGIFIFFAFLVASIPSFSQIAGSPYSSIGIGLLHDRGLVYHDNMGGLGLSNGNSWTLNNINPALLPLNTFTTFEAGITTEIRTSSSSESSVKNIGGNLSYLAIGLPMKSGKWTMAIGLMPYSNVNYNVTTQQEVVGDDTNSRYAYTGSGGYNHVYLSSGWKVLDALYLGVRASYVFSVIDSESRIIPFQNPGDSPNKNFFTSTYTESSRFSDFLLQAGILYGFELTDKASLQIGSTYELGSNVRTFRSEIVRMKTDSTQSDDEPLLADTISFNQKFSSYIPHRFGVGMSINKYNNWLIGTDFYYQNWSKYKDYKDSNEGMSNSYKIIVGGEWTPEYNSVTSYLKRVTYQMGFYYEKTPFFANNTSIKDFGMNFGLSLPVGSASLLNFGVNFGSLGTQSNGLIKDNYVKITLGLTFNDRSFGWYRNQRKFN